MYNKKDLPLEEGMISNVETGKTYSRIRKTTYQQNPGETSEWDKYLEDEVLNLNFLIKGVLWAETELKKMNLPTTNPDTAFDKRSGRHKFFKDNLWGYYMTILQKEHDSIPSLFALYLTNCRIALNDSKPLGERLHAAMFAGQSQQQLDYYLNTLDKQRNNSSKPKTPEINKMIHSLARISGSSAKELWPELYSMLDDEFGEVNDCEESGKPAYKYVNQKGDIKTLTFKTFENRLSAARKNPDSHG